MHSMCAPGVTRQMSRRYSHSCQTLSSMSCVTFPIAVLMHARNSGSVFGSRGIDFSGGPRRTNFRRNASWTSTKLLLRPNSRTHQLSSVGEAAISLQHWFTIFPRDGSSDCRTIPNVKFTVCNRPEFQDLATLPTQGIAYRNSSIIYTLSVISRAPPFALELWP